MCSIINIAYMGILQDKFKADFHVEMLLCNLDE